MNPAPQPGAFATQDSNLWRLPLAARIVLLAIVIAISTALVFAIGEHRHLVGLAVDNGSERLLSESRFASQQARFLLQRLEDDARLLARAPALRDFAVDEAPGSGPSRLRSESLLRALLSQRPGYVAATILPVGSGGPSLVVAQDPAAIDTRHVEGWAISALRAMRASGDHDLAFSAIEPLLRGNEPPAAQMHALVPIGDVDEQPRAALIITIDLDAAMERLEGTESRVNLYLVDGLGHAMLRTAGRPSSWLPSPSLREGGQIDGAVVRQLLADADGGLHALDIDGARWQIVGQRFPVGAGPERAELLIGVAAPDEQVFTGLASLQHSSMTIAALLVVVAAAVAALFAHLALRPLRLVHAAMADYGRSGTLGPQLPTHLNDEIGDFARQLQALATRLDLARRDEQRLLAELRAVIANAADGLLTCDSDGVLETVNPAGEQLFGRPSAELIGRRLDRLVDGANIMIEMLALATPREAGEGLRREVQCTVPSGIRKDLELAMSPLDGPDGRRVLCILRDVSLRKRTERQLDTILREVADSNAQLTDANLHLELAMRDVRSMTYIVSHDLRGPLLNLMGYSDELQRAMDELTAGIDGHLDAGTRARLDDVIDERIPKALGFIAGAASKMNHQLDVILQLSKLGRYDFKPQWVDVGELFESVVGQHVDAATANAVTVDNRETERLWIDADALQIIANNLVSNALKYRHAQRTLAVSIRIQQREDGVLISVTDNGRGIAERDRDKVFALFRRCGRQDTRGEGIGLAYCNTLVVRMGGRIWFDSALDEGTTFFVFLPEHVLTAPLAVEECHAA